MSSINKKQFSPSFLCVFSVLGLINNYFYKKCYSKFLTYIKNKVVEFLGFKSTVSLCKGRLLL